MHLGKEVKIILSKEANEVYEELNELVGQEKKKGVKTCDVRTHSLT